MKKFAPLVLMMFGTLSWATASSEEYSINVHVSTSHWVEGQTAIGSGLFQRLDVTIDGKKYELEGSDYYTGDPRKTQVLAIGDYKAKLVRDVHNSAYEFSQTYEFLFPDNKTRKFIVIGQTE